jgi:hypothetical protein
VYVNGSDFLRQGAGHGRVADPVKPENEIKTDIPFPHTATSSQTAFGRFYISTDMKRVPTPIIFGTSRKSRLD